MSVIADFVTLRDEVHGIVNLLERAASSQPFLTPPPLALVPPAATEPALHLKQALDCRDVVPPAAPRAEAVPAASLRTDTASQLMVYGLLTSTLKTEGVEEALRRLRTVEATLARVIESVTPSLDYFHTLAQTTTAAAAAAAHTSPQLAREGGTEPILRVPDDLPVSKGKGEKDVQDEEENETEDERLVLVPWRVVQRAAGSYHGPVPTAPSTPEAQREEQQRYVQKQARRLHILLSGQHSPAAGGGGLVVSSTMSTPRLLAGTIMMSMTMNAAGCSSGTDPQHPSTTSVPSGGGGGGGHAGSLPAFDHVGDEDVAQWLNENFSSAPSRRVNGMDLTLRASGAARGGRRRYSLGDSEGDSGGNEAALSDDDDEEEEEGCGDNLDREGGNNEATLKAASRQSSQPHMAQVPTRPKDTILLSALSPPLNSGSGSDVLSPMEQEPVATAAFTILTTEPSSTAAAAAPPSLPHGTTEDASVAAPLPLQPKVSSQQMSRHRSNMEKRNSTTPSGSSQPAAASAASSPAAATAMSYTRSTKRQYPARASNRRIQDLLHLVQCPLIENIDSTDFDVFAAAEKYQSSLLVVVAANVFLQYNFIRSLQLDVRRLLNFFTTIRLYYRDENPYHNAVHASDVLQTTHVYLCVNDVKENFSDVELFAVLFSALVHDVGHVGIANPFLAKIRHPFARLYSDASPLECAHAMLAFTILDRPECNMFAGSDVFTRQHFDDFRALVIEALLGTDMRHHADQTKNVAGILADGQIEDHEVGKLLKAILHAADLSNPMKPPHIYYKWIDRVMAEFWQQGDEEKRRGMPISILCDRNGTNVAKSQIGFINFVVRPFMKELAPVLPNVWLERLAENAKTLELWTPEMERERVESITAFAARPWQDIDLGTMPSAVVAVRQELCFTEADQNGLVQPRQFGFTTSQSHLEDVLMAEAGGLNPPQADTNADAVLSANVTLNNLESSMRRMSAVREEIPAHILARMESTVRPPPPPNPVPSSHVGALPPPTIVWSPPTYLPSTDPDHELTQFHVEVLRQASSAFQTTLRRMHGGSGGSSSSPMMRIRETLSEWIGLLWELERQRLRLRASLVQRVKRGGRRPASLLHVRLASLLDAAVSAGASSADSTTEEQRKCLAEEAEADAPFSLLRLSEAHKSVLLSIVVEPPLLPQQQRKEEAPLLSGSAQWMLLLQQQGGGARGAEVTGSSAASESPSVSGDVVEKLVRWTKQLPLVDAEVNDDDNDDDEPTSSSRVSPRPPSSLTSLLRAMFPPPQAHSSSSPSLPPPSSSKSPNEKTLQGLGKRGVSSSKLQRTDSSHSTNEATHSTTTSPTTPNEALHHRQKLFVEAADTLQSFSVALLTAARTAVKASTAGGGGGRSPLAADPQSQKPPLSTAAKHHQLSSTEDDNDDKQRSTTTTTAKPNISTLPPLKKDGTAHPKKRTSPQLAPAAVAAHASTSSVVTSSAASTPSNNLTRPSYLLYPSERVSSASIAKRHAAAMLKQQQQQPSSSSSHLTGDESTTVIVGPDAPLPSCPTHSVASMISQSMTFGGSLAWAAIDSRSNKKNGRKTTTLHKVEEESQTPQREADWNPLTDGAPPQQPQQTQHQKHPLSSCDDDDDDDEGPTQNEPRRAATAMDSYHPPALSQRRTRSPQPAHEQGGGGSLYGLRGLRLRMAQDVSQSQPYWNRTLPPQQQQQQQHQQPVSSQQVSGGVRSAIVSPAHGGGGSWNQQHAMDRMALSANPTGVHPLNYSV